MKRSYNMVVRNMKIYQNMKKKSWLNIEKNISKGEKMPYYDYMKLFSIKKSGFLSESSLKRNVL